MQDASRDVSPVRTSSTSADPVLVTLADAPLAAPAQAPDPGQLARVRGRIWVVGDVVRDSQASLLKQVADDLTAAVGRGCVVDVVFESSQDSSGYDGPATPFDAVAGIRRWRWPGDQRTANAVLHAKLLVIDGHRALIDSANITNRALSDNLEAGLLVRDPDVAAGLENHLRALMLAGTFVRTEPA